MSMPAKPCTSAARSFGSPSKPMSQSPAAPGAAIDASSGSSRHSHPRATKLSRQQFQRLVSALCILIGWEPLVILKDVRGLDHKEADAILSFAVRAIVEKALAEAHPRAKNHPS